MPILKMTLVSRPMTADMSGTRRQKRMKVAARIVARVSATTGPVLGVSDGTNGSFPDHLPRDEVGSSRIVQLSEAWARQRR